MRRRSLLLAALLVLAAAPGLRAEDEPLEARIPALEAETAAALEAHAAWCTQKRLFGKRDEAFERLLAFAPDHELAREKLRYTKDEETGAWVQHPRYKRPRNLVRKGQDEADAALAAILETHVRAIVGLCAGAESLADLLWARRTLEALSSRHPGREDIAPLQRTLALRYLAAVRERGLVQEMAATADWLRERHGAELAVRDALGEVEHEGVWVLKETARTLDEVAGLRATIDAARERTKPETSAATKVEQGLELPWTPAVATAHVRVAGTAKAEHLATVATACEVAGALFEQALGTAPAWRAGLTLYLFAGEDERAAFLKAFPVVDNVTLQHAAELDLVYADGQTLVVRALQERGQLDLAVNEILNQMIADTFLQSETPLAWHAEGISRYLAWLVTGTRMAINVSKRYAGDAQDRAVPDADTKWLPQVRARLAKQPAGLQLLLGKGTDVFSARDALVAYGFAIYLLEGHDGLAGEFLKSHYASKDVDRVCRGLLRMPRAVVEHRLVRWLDEVIARQEGNR